MSESGLASWGMLDLVQAPAAGDPVKTALLKTLETMLRANLPEMLTVKRDWLFPFDLAALDEAGQPVTPLPALFFYEEEEDPGVLGNRVAKNVILLFLVIYQAFDHKVYTAGDPAWQSFKDWSAVLAGKIHGLWQDRSIRLALKAAGLISLEEQTKHQAPGSEDYGELVLPVRLTYGHALGDAFSTAIN